MYAFKQNKLPIGDRMARMTAVMPDGCWYWIGYLDPCGYGRVAYGSRRSALSHRVAFELAKGPIPEGHEIDHLCFNRSCVNPDHLAVVRHIENCRRSARAGRYAAQGEAARRRRHTKTHCPHGHPYDETNTYITPGGSRYCRTCRRVRRTKRKEEK